MREGRYAIARSGVIFKENFESAQWTTRNSGVITDGSFFNGILTCNGTSTKVMGKRIERGVKAVRLKIILNSTTEDVLTLSASHSITITGGTISANGFAAPTIYVDGVASSAVTAGEHEILVTTATALTADAIIFGFVSSYFDGGFDLVEFFNEEISAARAWNLANNRQYAGIVLDGLIFDFDSRQGSFRDRISDTELVNTNGQLKKTQGGYSVYFDGTANLDTKLTLEEIFKDSFSISLVVKPDDGQPSVVQSLINSRDASPADNQIRVWINPDGSINFLSEANGIIISSNSSIIFNAGVNNWHDMNCVFDNTINGAGGLKVYLDTHVVGTGDSSGYDASLYTNSTTLAIGARKTGSTFDTQYDGYITSIKIYNRALTAEEIEQNYQYFRTQGMV